tara:strand:- start:1137 stop:1550 length:414 start_codon:yes stop_codon:yes gene_type:complete
MDRLAILLFLHTSLLLPKGETMPDVFDGDDREIDHVTSVALFGGLIRTIVYQPASVVGFRDKAEDLTGGKTAAMDDYEAVAEMFIQILTRIHVSGQTVTVGDFLQRVGDLLNVEAVEKAMKTPESVRTLDNMPVSLN